MPMFSAEMLSQIIRFYGNAMQGMMGTYLEKNIQAFIEIQKRAAGAGAGPATTPKLQRPRLWAQFMNMQAPDDAGHDGQLPRAERRSVFVQMQEQMQKQARELFPGSRSALKRPATER